MRTPGTPARRPPPAHIERRVLTRRLVRHSRSPGPAAVPGDAQRDLGADEAVFLVADLLHTDPFHFPCCSMHRVT